MFDLKWLNFPEELLLPTVDDVMIFLEMHLTDRVMEFGSVPRVRSDVRYPCRELDGENKMKREQEWRDFTVLQTVRKGSLHFLVLSFKSSSTLQYTIHMSLYI